MLGLICHIWAYQGACTGDPTSIERAHTYSAQVVALIETHACANSPCYDHQAIDVHLALLCLIATNRVGEAEAWLKQLIMRLGYVARAKKYWPMHATFQEALELRYGTEEVPEEFTNASILIPVIALWPAALGMADGYAFIRNSIVPQAPGTTLNVWSPDVGFESSIASFNSLVMHGIGEAIQSLPEKPSQYLIDLQCPLPTIQPIDESLWYQKRVPYIPLLAALHWRLQIPREMMAKQVAALVEAGPD